MPASSARRRSISSSSTRRCSTSSRRTSSRSRSSRRGPIIPSGASWSLIAGSRRRRSRRAQRPKGARTAAASATSTRRFETVHFLGTTAPVGGAAAPGSSGSVKAARVYDHGLCSATTSFGRGDDALGCGLWVSIAESVYGGFKEKVDTGPFASAFPTTRTSGRASITTRVGHRRRSTTAPPSTSTGASSTTSLSLATCTCTRRRPIRSRLTPTMAY